jgi:hypothetical protein
MPAHPDFGSGPVLLEFRAFSRLIPTCLPAFAWLTLYVQFFAWRIVLVNAHKIE